MKIILVGILCVLALFLAACAQTDMGSDLVGDVDNIGNDMIVDDLDELDAPILDDDDAIIEELDELLADLETDDYAAIEDMVLEEDAN
jgi:hypothetical protein